MKKLLFGLMALLLLNPAFTQKKYQAEIDLTVANNDQVGVSIIVPESSDEYVEYHMAKVVPGTYSISDFGRFVSNFMAFDKDGNELNTENISVNKWKIENEGQLHHISYLVDDTWDDFDGYGDNIIFEPGGSNINKDKETFVLNTFGFIGYINGQKFIPYELTVKHDETNYGATALKKQVVDMQTDIYYADDFNFLADGPIMYSVPDTITKKIANAEIIVSVYSPNKILSAKDVMDNIYDLMEAQSKFLGGKLPVDRYAYLIYLNDESTLSGSMGALEHSYSSVYSLPEAGAERIGQTVRDVAAHEFFHIVTPLNIHSEEIGKFNYIEPEMSKHLWMYEGVTEYNSMLVQVKYNLYGPDKFMSEIQDKLRVAEHFPLVSFTEMSEHILEPNYEEMYANVYYKGALIGMCLDLYLIKYSNGERNLQWLMSELAKKYGKEVSFQDDELFGVIEQLTYPEVGKFLRTYVAKATPLPISEVLSWAGVNYTAEKNVKQTASFRSGIGITLNENREIIVEDVDPSDEFATALGYQEGDIFSEINGMEFTLANAQEVIDAYSNSIDVGDKVKIVVLRMNKGKLKKVKLKAKAVEVETTVKHFLELEKDPTKNQYQVLQTWIVADK